ncbi:MAG: phosphoribosylamine--glycine ligase [Halanaerobiaceae bacterium]
MKILLIGSGGRETALAWKLSQSDRLDKLFIAPGNAGTAEYGTNIKIDSNNLNALNEFALKEKIDLTVVGPELPLAAGIVDLFKSNGLKIFGPDKQAARLESSKIFSKNLLKNYKIPTAKYQSFKDPERAKNYIKSEALPLVVKADGLAAGKGVTVAMSEEEALSAVDKIMVAKKFGQAGSEIVIEEYLEGEEATILAFCDGKTIKTMPAAQDHKAAYDGGRGPNTGGMGAYGPAPVVNEELELKIKKTIIEPTLKALNTDGIDFKGIIYFGLMITDSGAKVLEYNVRFGDPEAQVVLPLLETDLIDIMEAVINKKLDQIEIKWNHKKALCVVMASGGYPVKYEKGKEITGIKQAENLEDIKVFQAGTCRKEDKLITDGGRVLAVTALGDSFEEVIKKAYAGVENIYFEDFQIRNDIGYKALKNKI